MGRIKYLAIVVSLIFFGCTRHANQGGGFATGEAAGQPETMEDTLNRIESSDPDGIPGNGSTYGTGAGVSGQTPSGTGNGSGNTGTSGVGVREDLE